MDGLDHTEIFESLKKLVGDWRGINEAGEPVLIKYSLSANDSALVEAWKFDNGMDALTMFHMNGNTLMATHFCPIGNQPRFVLDIKSPRGFLKFEFLDATNLANIKDPHGHAFDMRMNDANTLERTETYVEDGGEMDVNGTVFHRVGV